jgi:hypothetical protein
VDFILRGSLPNLAELDLSHTAIKMLDLGEVVKVENLQQVFLMGCGQLRSISWPKTKMNRLILLCIDTRARGPWLRDSLMVYQGEIKEYCHAIVATADMRFLQSLEFLWTDTTIQYGKCNLRLSPTSNDDGSRSCHKEKMGRALPKLLTYHDISTEQMSAKIDVSNSSLAQFMPLDLHMEIARE